MAARFVCLFTVVMAAFAADEEAWWMEMSRSERSVNAQQANVFSCSYTVYNGTTLTAPSTTCANPFPTSPSTCTVTCNYPSASVAATASCVNQNATITGTTNNALLPYFASGNVLTCPAGATVVTGFSYSGSCPCVNGKPNAALEASLNAVGLYGVSCVCNANARALLQAGKGVVTAVAPSTTSSTAAAATATTAATKIDGGALNNAQTGITGANSTVKTVATSNSTGTAPCGSCASKTDFEARLVAINTANTGNAYNSYLTGTCYGCVIGARQLRQTASQYVSVNVQGCQTATNPTACCFATYKRLCPTQLTNCDCLGTKITCPDCSSKGSSKLLLLLLLLLLLIPLLLCCLLLCCCLLRRKKKEQDTHFSTFDPQAGIAPAPVMMMPACAPMAAPCPATIGAPATIGGPCVAPPTCLPTGGFSPCM